MKIIEFINGGDVRHGIDIHKVRDYVYTPRFDQTRAERYLNIRFIDHTEINLLDEEAIYFYEKLSNLNETI